MARLQHGKLTEQSSDRPLPRRLALGKPRLSGPRVISSPFSFRLRLLLLLVRKRVQDQFSLRPPSEADTAALHAPHLHSERQKGSKLRDGRRFATRDAFGQEAAACPSAVAAPAGLSRLPGEKEPVLTRPWPLPLRATNGKADFPASVPARFTNLSRLAVVPLICGTAIEGRQQRNESIASQFPSVANKINQALWKNQELYLQSASFYLPRNKQG